MAKDIGRLDDGGLGLGVRGDRTVMVDDDDLEGGGPEPGEVLLDDGSGRDGLAVRCLPPGAGERVLHVNGEDPEDEDHEDPSDEHSAEVGGSPRAKSGEGPPVARRERLLVSTVTIGDPIRPVRHRRPRRRVRVVETGTSGRCHGAVLCSNRQPYLGSGLLHGYPRGYIGKCSRYPRGDSTEIRTPQNAAGVRCGQVGLQIVLPTRPEAAQSERNSTVVAGPGSIGSNS